eukprot:5558958-Prymnesium_polylepis.1
MFNPAFQEAMGGFEASGLLAALRVVIGSDMVPRWPTAWLGGAHGTRARLLILPGDEDAPFRFAKDGASDADLWQIGVEDTHNCHALMLGGELDSRATFRVRAVPKTARWAW